MSTLSDLVLAQGRSSEADVEWLHLLVGDWQLLADLSFADMVLWVPTAEDGSFVAVAHARPSSAATLFYRDVVGQEIREEWREQVTECFVGSRIVDSAEPDWYEDTPTRVRAIPVLVVPPQIGRYYFTDLAPQRSFQEYAVGQGFQQFVISWRNPSPEQRDWGLETYAEAALEAMRTVAEITGQEKINVVAFCAGGILSSIVLGYLAAAGDDLINSFCLCVTMLNFENDASIGSFRLPAVLSVAQAQSKMKGVLGGQDLSKVFAWLRPNDLVWNYWVNNYLMGDTPAAFDILAWNKDSTNMAARLHADFLELFKQNSLVKQGEYRALGRPIDLSKITCDSFVVGAVTDHITPWKACYQACGYLGGDSMFALSNGGPVAALVNPPGNPKAYHILGPATAPDADAWHEAAVRTPGSWWEGWAKWCGERSGKRIPAPKQVGSKAFPPGADAPGEYVRQ